MTWYGWSPFRSVDPPEKRSPSSSHVLDRTSVNSTLLHLVLSKWLGEKDYNKSTGEGSIGVEFAGSAVTSPCPYGANITLEAANNASTWLQNANDELQWQDLYYRGYFELHFTHDKVDANFFGTPTTVTRNGWEIPLANFTVLAGENKLQRPVGGGIVESGSLKFGKRVQNNITLDTNSGEWFVSEADMIVL